ncbi:MAG: MFS transporter [Chloroflexota bacterium]
MNLTDRESTPRARIHSNPVVGLRAGMVRQLGSRYRWLVWATVNLVAFNQSIQMFASASLIPSLLADLNLNYALAGTITSAYMLALSIVLLPIGSSGDRIGGRVLTLAGLLAIFLGSALFAVAASYPIAMAGRVLIGAGAAAALVLPPPMLAFWFAKSEYRTVVGFHTSLGKMGSVIATWVLPPLIVTFGWRLGYGIVSLVCPLALLVASLFLANEPKEVGLGGAQGMAVSRRRQGSPSGRSPQPQRRFDGRV